MNKASELSGDLVLGITQSAMGQRWCFRTTDERSIAAFAQRYDLSDIVARILVGRNIGLEEVPHYLEPTLKNLMPDPFHLKDMDKAAARIAEAIKQQETIGIFGDYDVDGATSSALLARYFKQLDTPYRTYIPDRMKEGYGPNIEAFKALKDQGCKLIITVDCGAVAFEVLSEAKTLGLDVIVLDHHMGAAELPEAVAVVNPNRLDETSDLTYLAAVGVTFMTLVAVNKILRMEQEEGQEADTSVAEGVRPIAEARRPEQGQSKKTLPDLRHFLDFAALGTVCDVVPLKGLNRAFVTQGLKIMQKRGNAGLATLMDTARINEPASTYHLGYILGPRINAGGRVGKASHGVDLLTGEDPTQLSHIAEELEHYNAERKTIEQQVLEQASEQAEKQSNRAVLMVSGKGWHPGVIGIVAGRLKEQFHRPVAVLAIEEGIAKASARSVSGVDIGAAVSAARTEGLLLAGGGHAMAAGFSVEEEKISDLHAYFENRLEALVSEYQNTRALHIDAVVSPNAVTLELEEMLKAGAPYGMGNPSPKLAIAEAQIVKLDILKDSHIKLILTGHRQKSRFKAIAFRAVGTPLGALLMDAGRKPLHLVGQIKRNVWQDRESVDFHIDDAVLV